ncbi:complexed with cef1p [Coemansia sp. RSA 1722]|nr:complexed with cef1p [Coemansia sp. RSA 486]KAJ2228165.1 complexed with cef1p [Coemansia sp. RSA 485]KAJ2602350.1 complexed with cef1p [Coemansia sp. RSA 1722]
MTTAARPTFNPAKGKANDELSYMVSAKDLPGHTRLKTRRPGQGKEGEYSVEELKRELKEAERKHFENKLLPHAPGTDYAHEDESSDGLAANRTRYIEMAQMLDAASSDEENESGSEEDEDERSRDSDSDKSDGSGDDSDSEDDEDETALLMRELDKIKRERAEEKARQDQEAEESRLLNADTVLGANPLLSEGDFSVKRRWDEDVVFRNQARGDDGKPKKRFVNDMLRSDFHRKFMKKYIH